MYYTEKEIIDLIGKKEYIELLKKYNLCTKKWSYGRAKEFLKERNKLIKKREQEKIEKLLKEEI